MQKTEHSSQSLNEFYYMTVLLAKVTGTSPRATQAIRDFNAQGTQELLECKLKFKSGTEMPTRYLTKLIISV